MPELVFLTPQQITKYFERINFSGNKNISLETLSLFQKQHLLHIPFENLDIHSNVPIVLKIKNLYRKIILNKRGKFCFELNSLFYTLLKSLGYNIQIVSARVFNEQNGSFGKEFDHMTLIININGNEYLSDVGFGEFSVTPLEIVLNKIQKDQNGFFRIIKFKRSHFYVQRLINKKWVHLYLFSKKPQRVKDFAAMCKYHSSSPKSHFTQKKVCSQMTSEGRITLTDDYLKLTKNKKIIKRKIQNEKKFASLLQKYFNITMSNDLFLLFFV